MTRPSTVVSMLPPHSGTSTLVRGRVWVRVRIKVRVRVGARVWVRFGLG